MKYLALFSLVILGTMNTSFAQHAITYKTTKGSYTFETKKFGPVTINYDFGSQPLSIEHLTIDEFAAQDDLQNTIESFFGTKMHYETYLNDIAEDIYLFSQKNKLSTDDLLSVIISFVNSLEKTTDATYDSSYFYFPFEMILTGVHKELDAQSLFAGIFSSLCFDSVVIYIDEQISVGIRVNDDEDFYYSEGKYKSLVKNFEPQFARVFGYDRPCKFQKIYQEPVKSNFAKQLKLH